MPKATEGGSFKDIALPKPQTVVARCYSMIDLGTVPNIFKNKLQGTIRKVNFTFEFPTLKAVFNEEKGEEPFVTGVEFTLSTSDQGNLSSFISQWRNKPLTTAEKKSFDVNKVVGKTGMVSFIWNRKSKFKEDVIADADVTNQNTVLKLNGIMPKPEETVCPPMINPPMIWDWDEVAESGTFDAEKFMKIPKWLRNKMKESEEFKKFGFDPEDQQSGSGNAQATSQPAPDEKVDTDGW